MCVAKVPVFVPVRLRASRKVFANKDATVAENDPEGVAFEYEVIGP